MPVNIVDVKREVMLACTEFEVQRLFAFGSFQNKEAEPGIS